MKRDLEALVLDVVAQHPGGTLSLQSFKAAIDVRAPVAENVMQPDNLRAFTAVFPDRLPPLREAEAVLIAAYGEPKAIRAWPPGGWVGGGRP